MSRPEDSPRLLLELGRGGMGIVYLALAEGERLLVVKRLKADLAADPEFRQMLLGEARILARLTHPNIVRTFTSGFDGKHYYITMEWLDGQPFNVLLREQVQGLPQRLAVRVLCETLRGLHAAHELRADDGAELAIVHRDVSPHNVFITYDGVVKVLDFGIAKAADSMQRTRTGMIKGKATYMSPEQAARGQVDRRADVFAVGVILWEVLAGRRLWGERSEQEIFDALGRGTFESPRASAQAVPEMLERACMRAMAPQAADRFATAEAMRLELDAWLAQSGGVPDEAELGGFVRRAFSADRERTAREIATVRASALGPVAEPGQVPIRGFSATYALKLNDPTRSVNTLEPAIRRAVRTRSRWLAGGAVVVSTLAVAVVAVGLVRGGARTTAAGAIGGTAAAAKPQCTTNASCRGLIGGPAICRGGEGVCVALESPDCHVLASPAALDASDTLWLGTMFPTSGPAAAMFGIANANAAELARREIDEIAHGIPSTRAGATARPLGLVACDDAGDSQRAARHLVDDVRVPAVIGFQRSSEVLDLAASLFIPHRTLTVAALNQSSLITSIPHPPGVPRLVWRTTYSTDAMAGPLGAVVADLFEPKLRAGRLGSSGAMRVALVRPRTTQGRAFGDAVVTSLRVNGKPAAEDSAAFRDYPYEYTDKGETSVPADVIRALAGFRPHAIIVVGEDAVAPLVEPLERAWPADVERPLWLTNGPWEWDDFFAFVGKNAERRHRFFGLARSSASSANARFVLRYNEVFTPAVTRTDAPETPYDSVYLVAYAAHVAGDGPLDGVALAGAMASLIPPGRTVDVGAASFFDGIHALDQGEHIDLVGASGRLDFDLATGETREDFALLCVNVDDHGAAFDSVESGVVYDVTTGKLSGAAKCP